MGSPASLEGLLSGALAAAANTVSTAISVVAIGLNIGNVKHTDQVQNSIDGRADGVYICLVIASAALE